MKKFTNTIFCTTILIGLLFVSSCKKEVADKKYLGAEFSLDKFEQELKSSIGPSGAIGWTYIINQNGLFARGGGFGKSRNNADGNRSMTINRKIYVASCSKFLTAIAVMQLMERRSLTKDNKIAQWLPLNWNKGPGVSNITFGDLLGHTSGLSSVNSSFNTTLSYTGLRLMIDTGAIKSKNYNYLNANFALFRVMIPAMWKGLDDAPVMGLMDSATTETNYIKYMQEHVFEPIGLNNINCEPEDRNISTLYYTTTDGENNNGIYYTSRTSIAGGGGFFLTTFELATVLAYYKHSNVMLSNASRTIMEENRFGLERKLDSYEQHGAYYAKNGSNTTNGQGTYVQIAMFPNDIEVVVMFNSQGMTFAGGETTISQAIFDAYNKSWE